MAEPVTTCDLCGTVAPVGALPMTWTFAVENGREQRFCESCSRTHLRSMEAKLDSTFW